MYECLLANLKRLAKEWREKSGKSNNERKEERNKETTKNYKRQMMAFHVIHRSKINKRSFVGKFILVNL